MTGNLLPNSFEICVAQQKTANSRPLRPATDTQRFIELYVKYKLVNVPCLPFFPLSLARYFEFVLAFFQSHTFPYPASRGFSLAWLLAFTKSFTSLVSRVVGCDCQETRLKFN